MLHEFYFLKMLQHEKKKNLCKRQYHQGGSPPHLQPGQGSSWPPLPARAAVGACRSRLRNPPGGARGRRCVHSPLGGLTTAACACHWGAHRSRLRAPPEGSHGWRCLCNPPGGGSPPLLSPTQGSRRPDPHPPPPDLLPSRRRWPATARNLAARRRIEPGTDARERGRTGERTGNRTHGRVDGGQFCPNQNIWQRILGSLTEEANGSDGSVILGMKVQVSVK